MTERSPAPYHQSIDEARAALGTDLKAGISEAEASARLERNGPNELSYSVGFLRGAGFSRSSRMCSSSCCSSQRRSRPVLWAYERDAALPYEAIAIFAVVLLNATMGYVQESRAEAAVAALRAMSAADATVIRDGERRSIPATDIVPGDIIAHRRRRHHSSRRTRWSNRPRSRLQKLR